MKAVKWIVTVGPAGLSPVAPGTMGTLSALLVLYLLKPSVAVHLSIATISIVAGIWASGLYEKRSGRKDPQEVVIDEFAGYLVATAFLPQSVVVLLSAFALFRFFDILKPYPINKLERIGGGAGIMLDDLAAGLYTNLIIQAWRLVKWT